MYVWKLVFNGSEKSIKHAKFNMVNKGIGNFSFITRILSINIAYKHAGDNFLIRIGFYHNIDISF